MPSRPFLQDGLVHLSFHHDILAPCGAHALQPYVNIHSTDEAHAYAARLGTEETVTCMQCVAGSLAIDMQGLR